MSLIILRHQTVTLKDKVRAEDHWTIMNWSDLHLWEPEKVLWDLRPLDSLFSRIGQLVRLLSSRWPPSTHYLGGTSTVLTCWVADESWWDCLEGDQQPIMWLVSQFSEDDYLVILWLASCADPIPRSRLSLQILTKGESNPGILLLNIYADLENFVNDYAQIGFRNWQYMQRMK